MFIIPIGTKSTLALKPKLTIALIAANVLIGVVTMPLMMQTRNDLFTVQRVRLARELELYLKDRPQSSYFGSLSPSGVREAISDIENAPDEGNLNLALSRALSATGVSPQELQDYEQRLEGRSERAFERIDGASALFVDWQGLSAREKKITEGSVFNTLGLVPSKMGRVHTFITHLFLHAGIWHLLGNMLFLWVVGCLLEDTWGRVPFLLFYLAGGVIAGLAHSFQDTSSTLPLVGASGAIAAAMGAFTIRHFYTKIKLWYFFLVFIRPVWGTFYLPAFVFLPLWFAEQVGLHYISGFVGSSGVAYTAHIGGFAAGVAFALVARATGFESRFLAPRVAKTQIEAGVLRDPMFDRACSMLETGRVEGAKAAFSGLIAKSPENIDMIQDIALLYREKGLVADYGALLDRTLKLMLQKGRTEEAARLLLESIGAKEPITFNPQSLMRVAKFLSETGRNGEAHDVYRAIIAAKPSPAVSAKAHIALAKLLAEKMESSLEAMRVVEDARSLPLDDEWREALTRTEAEIQRTFSNQNA